MFIVIIIFCVLMAVLHTLFGPRIHFNLWLKLVIFQGVLQLSLIAISGMPEKERHWSYPLRKYWISLLLFVARLIVRPDPVETKPD